jgi:hypothetical protein
LKQALVATAQFIGLTIVRMFMGICTLKHAARIARLISRSRQPGPDPFAAKVL